MAATHAPAAALQTAILELELTGEVQRLSGNRVVKMVETDHSEKEIKLER